MQSIILGIKVAQVPKTILIVGLPELDVSATAQLVSAGNEYKQLPLEGLAFQADLTPGEYVLIVDSVLRPSVSKPFVVTTDADASFWSAAHPDPETNPRPWQGGTGRTVMVSDPKDPWPPPPLSSPTSDAFLASSSPIGSILAGLLSTNVGRGAESSPWTPGDHSLPTRDDSDS